jgi:DNA-binding PadR family transcriptional regulator
MEKMSAGNLMILGFLLDKPMSAYDMVNLLETQVIGRLIKISSPTVYKNIKTLHQQGYLTVEVAKQGEMPEKKIYTVTDEGYRYFLKLMKHFSGHIHGLYFDCNAFLANIGKLDKDTGLKLLENLRTQLCKAKEWIANHEREAIAGKVFFAGRAIIMQHRMVVNALVEWIQEVIKDYGEMENFGKYSFHHEIGKHSNAV